MINEFRYSILKRLLPPEKKFFDLGDTQHDQCVVIGWNMYRAELLNTLYPDEK